MLDLAYEPTGIPELDENPLINKMPPLMGLTDIYRSLEQLPSCTKTDRCLAPHLRAFLVVARLQKAFIPTGPQAIFAQQVHMLIRAGYAGVSLTDSSYAARLADLADQIEAGKRPEELFSRFSSTAYCGTLIGVSGMGKTTIVGRTLARIPQVILHEEPVTVRQIVHMRLECPSTGSPKRLSLAFLAEVDRLLETDYSAKYSALTTEALIVRMATVAQLHRLGLLVVDEIQFLRSARVDEDHVLNLLTTLVNVINVPVLLVGTMAAVPLVTKTFRIARRAQGVGSAIFEPMKKGPEWDRFLQMLFRLQWTREVTQLDADLSEALWEESQGIIDIVTKLFILAQLQLIRRSETRSAPEIITPKLVRRIAKEELRLVRPLLRALRNGSKTVAKYDDLRPLEQHFADLMASYKTGDFEFPTQAAPCGPAPSQEAGAAASVGAALAAVGFGADEVSALVAKAKEEVPSEDPLGLLAAVLRLATPAAAAKPRKRCKSAPKASEAPLDSEDVRRFTDKAGAAAGDAYGNMVAAGLIQPAAGRVAA